MRQRVTAYIGLGANLGDAVAALSGAMADIGALDRTTLILRSSFYESVPVDAQGPNYTNAVVEISTGLSAPDLLCQLQCIEAAAGRERPYRNAPRTLDLDILLYGQARVTSPSLQIPHPRMAQRAFVLVPLAEIAPGLVEAAQLQAVGDQSITRIGH